MTTDHRPTLDAGTPFEDILDAIEAITRQHALTFRLSLGRLMLDAFFAGDPRAYTQRGGAHERRFRHFFSHHADDLARYGIGEQTARHCIRGWLVLQQLPPALQKSLFFTQIVELARLPDPFARAELAAAAVRDNWTVLQLREAVTAMRDGATVEQAHALVDDGAAEQGAAAPAPPQAGRVAGHVERWISEIDAWSATWEHAPPSKMRRPQRQRLRAAVEALQARLTALQAKLGERD